MSLPVALRPLARVESDEAVAWYEAAQPGLGTDLEAAVEAVFQTISATPEKYPLAEDDVREAPVRRFRTASTTECGRRGWSFSPSITSHATPPGGEPGRQTRTAWGSVRLRISVGRR